MAEMAQEIPLQIEDPPEPQHIGPPQVVFPMAGATAHLEDCCSPTDSGAKGTNACLCTAAPVQNPHTGEPQSGFNQGLQPGPLS